MAHNRTEITIAAGLGIAAALLHGYEAYFLSEAPGHWSFVWPMLPYVIFLHAVILSRTAIPAIVGASVALAFDGLAHYDVFVNPRGSTAALALLFIPLWNLLVVVPAALVVAHVLLRRKRGRRQNVL